MTDTNEKQNAAIVPYREPIGGDRVTPFIPADFPSVFRFAELLAASGDMVPKAYVQNPQKIATAIFFGYELGLLPLQALQSVAVINGKPSIYGDSALGLVRASGQLDDFEETFEGDFSLPDGKPNPNFKAVCKITRKGAKRPTTSEFSIGDAQMAGLWNKEGPWRNYPKRMLKFRARGFGLRDEFTDTLRGLVIAEEAQDYDDMRDITPAKETPPAPPEDTAAAEPEKAKRTRKPANRHQEEPDRTTTIEGEKVQEQAAEPEEKAPNPDQQQVEKARDPEPEKAKPAEKAKPKPADKPAASYLDPILEAVGRNKPLKEHLVYLDKHFATANTIDEMKEVWGNRDRPSWLVKEDNPHIEAVRDWHKARIRTAGENAASEEQAPNPDEPAAQFDYAGYLHELDVKLGSLETADDVNRVYQEITAEPIRLGLISEKQEDADLKPMLAAHLDRTDFG